MTGTRNIHLRAIYLLGGILMTIGCLKPVFAQWEVGANLTLAIPQDEFDEVTDTGTGLALKALFRVLNVPHVSVRADAAFITYQFGQHVEYYYSAETRTQSIRLTVGPQLSIRRQRIDLYLSPMYGLYYFYTHDDMFDIYGNWLTRTRNSNTEFGWNVGGGVLIDIAHMPKRGFDLALDIGGSWHNVRRGIETDVEVEGNMVNVKQDVRELCIHAGVMFLFR